MKGIYMVGGYPDLNTFETCYKIACDSQLDFIEIGIPFNDPVADGPVIAKAIQHVVDNKITMQQTIKIVAQDTSKTIVAMTYANIIYDYGYEKFSKNHANIFDGLIIPDVPNKYNQRLIDDGLSIPLVPFVTPETRPQDLAQLANTTAPFIYYVGVRGVTGGSGSYDTKQMQDTITEIKKFTNIPVIVGFGIKNKIDADKIMKFADGFVVGTEIVKKQTDPSEFKLFLEQLL